MSTTPNPTSGSHETGQQVREKLNAAKDRVASGVQNGREKMTQQVKQNPLKSLLYAFGAGALLGLLLRRRGRG